MTNAKILLKKDHQICVAPPSSQVTPRSREEFRKALCIQISCVFKHIIDMKVMQGGQVMKDVTGNLDEKSQLGFKNTFKCKEDPRSY